MPAQRERPPRLLSRRALLPWLAVGPCAWAAETLRMVSDEAPPYVLRPQRQLGGGIDVDIARQAFARHGGPDFRLDILPWRRALDELAQGKADFAPAVRRTAEREAVMAFSLPYGVPVQHALISRTGNRRVIKSRADLAGLRVGLVQGYAYPPAVLEAIGPRTVWAVDKAALLRMAAAERFDVALLDAVTGAWMAHDMGLAGVLRQHPWVIDEHRQTQFAFSRRSARAMAALEILNKGLASLSLADVKRFEKPYMRPFEKL